MSTILSGQTQALDGSPFDLEALRGRPVLFVNVASRCGFTPQYTGLEALWRRYRDQGLVVVGVPSNDFGAQEPGTAEEIRTFCSTKYEVSFPLLAKQPVKGPGKSSLYAALSANADEPKWNFHKYLVGRDGSLAAAFASDVEPLSDQLTGEIEKALAG